MKCTHCYGLGKLHSPGRNGDPMDSGVTCSECEGTGETTIKLKSCPFCDGDNVGYIRPGGSWQFVCMGWNCGAAGPPHDDRLRAIECWNDRPVGDVPHEVEAAVNEVVRAEHALRSNIFLTLDKNLAEDVRVAREELDELIAGLVIRATASNPTTRDDSGTKTRHGGGV